MNASIKNVFKQCCEYKSNIMDDVISILNNNNIEFTNENKYEIIIRNSSTDTINNLIHSSLDIDGDVINALLFIAEKNDIIYIRQKSN